MRELLIPFDNAGCLAIVPTYNKNWNPKTLLKHACVGSATQKKWRHWQKAFLEET